MPIYINANDDYTPVFPGTIYDPPEYRDLDAEGIDHSQSFVVPGTPYKYLLDFLPISLDTISVEVGGVVRSVVPYPQDPTEGEVSVSFYNRIILFNVAHVGLTCEISYRGKGSVGHAQDFIALSKELVAVQTEVQSTNFLLPEELKRYTLVMS